MKCFLKIMICMALAAPVIPAQPGEKGGKDTTPAPIGVILRFQNGSVIQPAILLDTVEMETKIGKLQIPGSELRKIDFGFRLSEEDAKKVEQALQDLNSKNFKERDSATKLLTEMGRNAYPFLLEHKKGAELEVAKRIDGIVQTIKTKVASSRLQTRRTDIVKTSDSSLNGLILSANIRFKSDLFGETKVPIHMLRELQSLMPGGDTVVMVDAAKYGQRFTWMDTEYEVPPSVRLEITTTGTIDLDPGRQLGRNDTSVTAAGTPQYGSGEPQFLPGMNPWPGMLIGKIGQDGPPFVVGTSYRGNPGREGKLYLRVITIEHANNIKSKGSYSVKIVTDTN